MSLNRKEAEKLYDTMIQGLKGKKEQIADIKNFWEIYNVKWNHKQRYAGVQPKDTKIYVSVVRDAIEAKQLRLTNMLFPQNGQFAGIIGMDDRPMEHVKSLLNYYVRKAKLKLLIGSLIREGEITGQFSLFVEWSSTVRKRIKKVKRDQMDGDMPTLEDTSVEEEEEFEDCGPVVWVIPTEQLVVLPATVDRIEDADLVGVLVWETEKSFRAKVESGEYQYDAKKILDMLEGREGIEEPSEDEKEDSGKFASLAAGVKIKEGAKRILVYQIWANIKGKPSVVMMAGKNIVLRMEENPYYSQRIPIISAPYKKIKGSFWGQSAIKNVAPMQYALNDVANMGMDSAAFSLMPIVMTDPKENPAYESMMVSLAAIWMCNPASTKFVEMPPLWQITMGMMEAFKNQIMESLGMNPTMIPQGGYKKPTQAEIAAQQQLAVESVDEQISILEEEILGPLLQWFYELDVQFRNEPLRVSTWGEEAQKIRREEIPVFEEMGDLEFMWMASEVEKNVQKVQQQVSAMNLLANVPPQALDGKKLDLGPIIQNLVESVFGPRMSGRILKSVQDQLSVPPQTENMMMYAMHPVQVHPMDNDVEHIQVHMQGLQEVGGGHEALASLFESHIQEHEGAIQQKQAAMAPPRGNKPGGPPGVPRPGAQITPLKGPQNPAGAIHQDRMKGPGVVPRPPRS